MRRWLTAAVVVVVALYGLYEARQLIAGPEVTVVSPTNGTATSSPAITVAGIARNISFLTINNDPAYTDEEGHFYTTLTPPPGLTTVTVAATDRFGRAVSKTVFINVVTYCQELT